MKQDQPVALITGASRGIGREIALEFAREKYRVAVHYVQSDALAKKVALEILTLGSEAMLLKADVRDSGQVKKMIGDLLAKWGRVDVLINNAGLIRDRTILKMTDEEWNDVLQVNLSGSFWCLRECARAMSKQKEGSILNVSSMVGVRGGFGNSSYAAAKAGVIGLTKGAAKELGRFNIRVNALLPGFHETDMTSGLPSERKESLRSEHALERFTDLNELARFIVFISRQKSASGQVFNFDSRTI